MIADRELAPGTVPGSYRIERPLGRGGLGAVFLAYDTRLHRRVALKILDGHAEGDASGDRVLREAGNAAALSHPHICKIHEVGEANGTAFIAMEYVQVAMQLIDGRTVGKGLAEWPLPVDRVLDLAVQLADALANAV
jgi:eukaryotic-like serine/threonine-protein kinase